MITPKIKDESQFYLDQKAFKELANLCKNAGIEFNDLNIRIHNDIELAGPMLVLECTDGKQLCAVNLKERER